MTIRKMFFLFWTTVALGIVTAPLASLFVKLIYGSLGVGFTSILWAGVLFGVVAQMGFFAYLVFNMVAKGFIRNPYVYQALQLLAMAGVLIWLFQISAEKTGTPGPWILPSVILGVAWVAAWFKVKATTRASWIPALFFMVVATVLEAIPSLEQNSFPMILLMVLVLLVCNTWQMMQLHRLLESKEEDRQKSRTR
ncbi:KinB-signaling pathway activation protein [Kroppenstedtia guangzhouensis]|uniref:KinB-signaling pathway activation protein n=1 Tax=Kroppenstedtia guangzhouensis TaxID=1274356 RepID=A0ABQ1H111_9BACL|nr:KinB-signaling pathway activation protein [Kroppenstedtia guangzhouensis]GGA53987.1 KinB-signaling pathway activation protein [Kroppenstedtia guangzhouensis]